MAKTKKGLKKTTKKKKTSIVKRLKKSVAKRTKKKAAIGKKKEPQYPKTKEERMSNVKKFSKKVIDNHGKMIKCIVMMGSVARDEFKPKSDIDLFVVIDDTTGKLTRESHNAIDRDIEKIAREISPALSIQPSYTLTEFWDYARVCHPIIYNFIKEGVPLYDAGFFLPIKRLLNMGKIPSTREAIENYMEGAPKKLMRAKTVKLLMLAEDAFYAMLNTTQAVMMFMGLPPPVPNKAYEDVKRYLVEPGILDPEYAEWLKEIIEIRKKIEHKEMTTADGELVDKWIDRADKYVEKMFGLLNALELRKKEKVLERTHDVMHKAAVTALKNLKKLPEKESEISVAFKHEFVDSKLIDAYYWDLWKRVDEMKKKVDSDRKNIKDLPEREVYQARETVRKMIRDLVKALREKGIEEMEEVPEHDNKKD
ncbi:MAG: nucleotidyltransferase domain-containing protein [Kosmotogaceae bacterium]|nr:nucleotidyltransferase domain-containing protein [Kosmotogaceae bacterium]